MSRTRRPVAAWWRDAKFGIFVHWTPASVPAFAPTGDEIGALVAARRPDALAHSPYTEWYQNSLRFPDSPVARWHAEHHPGVPYEAFADDFRAGLATWDPDDWARTFRDAGARYVVLVAKHHDGFCLWPSAVRNPHRDGWHAGRDVVGELAEAVRGAGLRFGVYYSGGLDWTFDDTPIGTVADLLGAMPGGDYPAYAEAQVRELIERYRPSVLWNDISWPDRLPRLRRLVADYRAAVPDGVINDRWLPWSPLVAALRTRPGRRLIDEGAAWSARRDRGIVPPRPPIYDVRTPEYTTFPTIQAEPWECVRGIDRSFGYNRESTPDHHLGRDDLRASIADIVAKNGNLLLNVGPRGEDATIPPLQLERLGWAGEWWAETGSGLYDTRPWVRAEAQVGGVGPVRFTARGRDVWVVAPGGLAGTVALPGVVPTATTEVHGPAGPLAWSAGPDGMEVEVGTGATSLLRCRDVLAGPEAS